MDIILVGASLLTSGFLINKGFKNPREISERKEVSENEIPHGNNVYSSNEVQKQTNKLQETLTKRYNEAMDSNSYLVHPNSHALSHQPGNGVKEYESFIKTTSPVFDNYENKTPTQNELASYSIRDDKYGSPLTDDNFYKLDNKNPSVIENFTENTDVQISALSGKPVEMVHNNMMPFIRGDVKQPGFNSLSKLNTYSKPPKREVETLFAPQKQDLLSKQSGYNEDISRYLPSNIQSGINPFKEEREAPLFTDKVSHFGGSDVSYRYIPKTIEEFRVKERPVLKMKHNPGHLSKSGILPFTYLKNSQDTVFKKKVSFTGIKGTPKKVYTGGLDRKKNKHLVKDYFGSKTGIIDRPALPKEERNVLRNSNKNIFDINNSVPNPNYNTENHESFTPNFNQRNEIGGKIYSAGLDNVQNGMYNPETNVPDITLKQTGIFNKSGFIGGHATQIIDDYSKFEQKITNKQLNIVNDYKGVANSPVSGQTSRKKYEKSHRNNIKSKVLHKYQSGPRGPSFGANKDSIGSVKVKKNKELNVIPIGSREVGSINRNFSLKAKPSLKKDFRMNQDIQHIKAPF